MTNPVVSIITPTYNHERFIGTCIESVLAQSFQDWEMIIVDDGSTDGTAQAISIYADPRIVYIRQNHVGPYRMDETYNRALARARAKLIAILEGDDEFPDNKLEQQLAILHKHGGVVGSCGRVAAIDANSEILGVYPLPDLDGPNISTRDLLLRSALIYPVSLMIRRHALDRVGGFAGQDNYPAVDLPTLLHLSEYGPIRFDDQILGMRREHGSQVTSKYPFALLNFEVRQHFLRSMSPDSADRIGVTPADLHAAHRANFADYHWGMARQAASRGQWRESRDALRMTLHFGNSFRKLEAVVAYAATVAKFDLSPSIDRLAATHWGGRIVERHNPLARHERPEMLAASPSAEGPCHHGGNAK